MEVGITVVSTIATSMIRSSSLAILEVRSFTIRIHTTGTIPTAIILTITDTICTINQVIEAGRDTRTRAGYYHGSIDGVNGNGTRRAIREYERAHGLPGDGKMGQQLLTTMGLS